MIDLREFATLNQNRQRACVAAQMATLVRTILLYDRHSHLRCTKPEAELLHKCLLLTMPGRHEAEAVRSSFFPMRTSILRLGVRDHLLSTSLRFAGPMRFAVMPMSLRVAEQAALSIAEEIRTRRFDDLYMEHVDLMRSVMAEVDTIRQLRRAVLHEGIYKVPGDVPGLLPALKKRLTSIRRLRGTLWCFNEPLKRRARAKTTADAAYMAHYRNTEDQAAKNDWIIAKAQRTETQLAMAAFKAEYTAEIAQELRLSATMAAREAKELNTGSRWVRERLQERADLELRERRILFGYFPAEMMHIELADTSLYPDPLPVGVAPVSPAEDIETGEAERYVFSDTGEFIGERETMVHTVDGALQVVPDKPAPRPDIIPVPVPQDFMDVLDAARSRFASVMRSA
jgi:hypothetical protein